MLFDPTFSVRFSNISEITEFVGLCEQQPFVINAFVNDYCVNAKSLLGMIYLSTEGTVCIAGNGCSFNEFQKFREQVARIVQIIE